MAKRTCRMEDFLGEILFESQILFESSSTDRLLFSYCSHSGSSYLEFVSLRSSRPHTEKMTIEAWLKEKGAELDSDSITFTKGGEPHCGGSAGPRVVAAKSIKAGQVCCTIPKSAVLSVKNCELKATLGVHQLVGNVGIALAFLHERRLGKKSHWFGYFSTFVDDAHNFLDWSLGDLGACLK